MMSICSHHLKLNEYNLYIVRFIAPYLVSRFSSLSIFARMAGHLLQVSKNPPTKRKDQF